MRIFAKLYRINLYREIDFSSLKTKHFSLKVGLQKVYNAVKNLKIRNSD